MKAICPFILTISFACNLIVAQDTIYVYKAGALIRKQAVTDIDSITFHKDYGTTLETVTDIDGNIYHTITIGTQTWMVENLKTTKYSNGDAIPNITDNNSWVGLTSGAYCNYSNDANNAINYGRLYNFYAVSDARNIAPAGWHVPTDAEWTTLTIYLTNNGYGFGGSGDDVAKSMAYISGWDYYPTSGTVGNNQTSNNSSGFNGLPGGCRYNSDGTFHGLGSTCIWWSSTAKSTYFAWYREIYNFSESLGRYDVAKQQGVFCPLYQKSNNTVVS